MTYPLTLAAINAKPTVLFNDLSLEDQERFLEHVPKPLVDYSGVKMKGIPVG
jgi:hypothetical protein